MSLLTTFFNLIKPEKTDPAAIAQINADLDTIDTEMHRPPLTVNETEPDETTRNIRINVVPYADNLTSDQAQVTTGAFIARTSGGGASVENGDAWLNSIRGNMVKTGYVAESLDMTVTPVDPDSGITASIDRDTWVSVVTESGTTTFIYTSSWSADPATYGITVDGTPAAGDTITVVYVKENRGTITTAQPTSFVSTGWNLYNHAVGYARVVDYSDEYMFAISGAYTALTFGETLTGGQQTITPVNGFFAVPGDGYVFVTGGNDTDTAIWMTWSDWTDEPNEGTWEAYTATTIDLSGVMVDFPAGLMRIGNAYDEINPNTSTAISRIQRMEYTDANLESVQALGVDYDTDQSYIYAVRQEPATYSISLDGSYTVNDHGEEFFTGTSVPVTAVCLYGNNLKDKLRRDVLTISQQDLTAPQKAQVQSNLGLVIANNLTTTAAGSVLDARQGATLKSGLDALSSQLANFSNSIYSSISNTSSSQRRSVVFTFPASYRGLLVVFFPGGTTGAGAGLFIVTTSASGSGGTAYCAEVFKGASLTVSTSGNTLTVTNGTATAAYPVLLNIKDAPTNVSYTA